MHSIETINRIIALLFAICYFYQYIYVLVPYFKKYRIVPKNSGNKRWRLVEIVEKAK